MIVGGPVTGRFAERCAAAACRSCGVEGLDAIVDFGPMPLSDGFVAADRLDEPDPRFPLELAACPACGLVQIIETVPPEVLFGADYPYFSSFSTTLLEHSRAHAMSLVESCRLHAGSLVVELASNDGYFLRHLAERGVPVLGIDPAPGPARAAEAAGVPTINAFFDRALAERLREQGRVADVIVANNVLAHVADTNGFVAGIATLLADDGVAVLEFPYLRDLVDHVEFDTIYHEHLCYFSLHAVDALFRRHGLFVTAVDRLPIHGGSLRIRVRRREAIENSVTRLLLEEHELGMNRSGYATDFGQRVAEIVARLDELLRHLAGRGHRLAAYGAAAKGTMLLNAIPEAASAIEFVVDRNVHKHGRWVPGVRIPILDVPELARRRPDHAVLLPWNLADEIVEQELEYRAKGGRFIVPIPEPRVI